jgi:hypothetical protein
VSFTYEKWVAAGKPCLRQSCGHPHADHIPSEAMECDQCDCLRLVGFAHPDDCRCGRQPGGCARRATTASSATDPNQLASDRFRSTPVATIGRAGGHPAHTGESSTTPPAWRGPNRVAAHLILLNAKPAHAPPS